MPDEEEQAAEPEPPAAEPEPEPEPPAPPPPPEPAAPPPPPPPPPPAAAAEPTPPEAASSSATPEEAAEEKEVAELKEMMKRPKHSPPRKKKPVTSRPAAPKPEWNSTPHRSCPPSLKGIKTQREPWAKDDKFYEEGMQGHGAKPVGPGARAARPKAAPSPDDVEREYQKEYKNWLRRTQWNSTPFRNCPDQLRGLQPVTREPWYEDMAIYNKKFPIAGEGHDTGTLGSQDVYDDESALDAKNRKMTVEEANWDSSTWKYVPHSLKGIKPVTNEPWARDEAVYNESRNSVDVRGSSEWLHTDHRTLGLLGNDGEMESWDAGPAPPKGAMRAYPA